MCPYSRIGVANKAEEEWIETMHRIKCYHSGLSCPRVQTCDASMTLWSGGPIPEQPVFSCRGQSHPGC